MADPRIAAALAIEDPDARNDALQVLIDEASAIGRQKTDEAYRQHCAFHGRDALRMVVVERRRGYRGRSVCADCYYGKEWR